MSTKKYLYIFLFFQFLILSSGATDHLKPVMEPYKLMGKRLVFTNWFYVRAGHFEWLEESLIYYAWKKKEKK